ncbi:hypothetical protein GCM10023205_81830 [Yinghuangia aomiensis]|uniref:Uncharacterized protein n=1 Tax=Yinghuangia aomiensis TaxID=676205 RepID=A0ABP9IG01_9ACTN
MAGGDLDVMVVLDAGYDIPIEDTFRLFKQILGWTAPKLRDPDAADRWTWIVIAAHAQLFLARPLAEAGSAC